MEFPRRRRLEGAIDLVPIIDTLLQLFLIFLLSASFAASAAPVDLAQGAPGASEPAERLLVTLTLAGEVFVGQDRIPPDELRLRVEMELAADKRREVVLRADKQLPYERVLEALAEVQHAGATRLHLSYQDKP